MKTRKNVLVLVMALAVMVTMVPSTAEIKAKKARTYKTKTITVVEGKDVQVKTKKKIKSVNICSKDTTFEADKLSSKKFYVGQTTYGVKQTVKVKYTNGYTQKFKIKTVPDTYGQKIVNELKPLLADPDEGLKKVLADWVVRSGRDGDGSCRYIPTLSPVTYSFNNKKCQRNRQTKSKVYITDDKISEAFGGYSGSEKQAFIITAYMQARMTYDSKKKTMKSLYNGMKSLYNGSFKGVCMPGATAAGTVCRYLGIKSKVLVSNSLNHGWCCMYVKDKNGNAYWKGIDATAFSIDMKKIPDNDWDISVKQLKKYAKNPATILSMTCRS